ncbi:hypothetical protein [Candidatus Pelagibacter communis]|uniref:hypothetical protein n=1 Tax=Pelagibacter ubique TaxID=198252 RepID=UPI00094C14CE|nr:hypothetical protein [Candidatus Pelagibacter ubique]
MKIQINDETRDMTAEELAQRETDTANRQAKLDAEQADKEAKDTLKASAKAKLVAGEALTQEEADTIVL